MSHSIIVVLPVLEEAQRDRIRVSAEKHGFSLVFCESDQQALPYLPEAEIVLGQSTFLSQNATSLRWLCTPSAGVDHFLAPDVFASPNAVLTNSSGAYGVTIAEHIIMTTLEVFRRQQEYNEIVKQHAWQRDLPICSIKGSRITLLGTGDIGQEAALRLRSFGPRQILGVNRGGRNPKELFDRVVQQEDLDSVLPETDLLILSLPNTPETHHMLNKRRLALLPENTLIVNVGRGNAIDEKALEAELRSGRLRAALDVFEKEPLDPSSSLWACPNLLITPHIAGNMTLPYTRERIVSLFLEDLENYCAGRPLSHQVDLQRGY